MADLPTSTETTDQNSLPSVTSYSLSDDDSFSVELQNPCYIHFDYLVYYDRKTTGKLQVGSITNLNGIEVKGLFLWLDVDEIRVDLPPSNNIYFQVGIINKKLNVDQFEILHWGPQSFIDNLIPAMRVLNVVLVKSGLGAIKVSSPRSLGIL